VPDVKGSDRDRLYSPSRVHCTADRVEIGTYYLLYLQNQTLKKHVGGSGGSRRAVASSTANSQIVSLGTMTAKKPRLAAGLEVSVGNQ
jgi:hypothetical protein